MARMTSDLSDIKPRIPAPKDLYVLRVTEKEDTKSKTREKDGRLVGGNPMAVLDWEITEGPEMGKKIAFDNLILSGKNEKGGDIVPFRLAEFLHCTGVPWECLECHNGEEARKFYYGEGPDKDGMEQGKPYCPNCKSPRLKISYETNNFVGAICRGVVDQQKAQNSDDMYNIIKKYLPLTD